MARRAVSATVADLEALARTQLGLFTSSDACHIGVSRQLLSHHARPGGRWTRVLPGVYQLAGLGPDPRRRLLAALLWGGDRAVLSHRSAGAILRLDGITKPVTELWAPGGGPLRASSCTAALSPRPR